MAGFDNEVVYGKNADFTSVDNQNVLESNGLITNSQLWIGSTATNVGGTHINVGTLTSPNSSITFGYSSPNITAVVNTSVVQDLHVAKWIVNATPNAGGNQTTITAALTAAVSGETIFVMPGTYTENLTLKAGVNICAFNCDALNGNVIINGTISFSGAGTVDLSGIRLQTNSANCISVSGSAASIVNFKACYINCTNNTGISFTTANTSAVLNFYECEGDIGTTGIGIYSMSSTGAMNFFNSIFTNTGASTTASSNSAGNVAFFGSNLSSPFSTSSTGILSTLNSSISTMAQNATCITTAGTGSTHAYLNSYFTSGSASAISIGSGTSILVANSVVTTSNTNAITGAGTLNYTGVSFGGTSFKINTTTQIGGILKGGQSQAPSVGFVGESISSNGGVSITTNIPSNITSIALTAGIWDVSGLYTATASCLITGATLGIGVNSASFTGVSFGDNGMQSVTSGTVQSLSIPSFRVTLTTTTTYFLIQQTTFAGTASVNGRISGTRVG